MKVRELKNRCLASMQKEKQLADAEKVAGNRAMESYHNGRMQVWHEVHTELVSRFKDEDDN
jgi:hypothetical protein